MWTALREGILTALRQPFVAVALFIYQLVWGVVLYKFVQDIVSPIMHRYPGGELTQEAMGLFLAESQFQLLKTDLTHSYLWWLLILLIIRMVFHPVLNAALYYSLHHTHMNSGYRFVRGIMTLSPSYFIYYLLQTALLLTPLYWLLPFLKESLSFSPSYSALLMDTVPVILAYFSYGFLLNLAFTYIQLGKAVQKPVLNSLSFLLRYLFPIVLLAITLLLFTGLITLVAITASLIWAGFAALLLYQGYRFIQILFQMWMVSSQYRFWMNHSE